MRDEGRILVVDDDEPLGNIISQYLGEAGYGVVVARNKAELLVALERARFDLVLLDLGLPDAHGLELARLLRSRSAQLGIIVISGTTDSVDKVVSLELGADDFVPKPFDQRELLARVRAVLRRVNEYARATGEGRVRFGDFELDLDTHELCDGDGQIVHLTTQEFALLKAMVKSGNRVLNREQILQSVSGRDWFYSDRSVDVLVGKLRKKIEDDPARPKYIKTIRGAGYKFAAPAAALASA
ncbi:MAG: response regulator transcription factor [Pseudomonadales bacterium]|nr:response regulator transcription factor [Pseudomonadales bacterium]